MKKILLFSLILLVSISVQSQVTGGKHDKLFDLFLLEKYEDCYYKAYKMTENDKYRYDAEPLLYVSMAALKLANDPSVSEEYPDAFKNMIKFAQKAVKIIDKLESKDQETISVMDQEDYFQELKDYSLNEIFFIWVENKFSKAASLYRKLLKVYPEDENVLFLAGAGEIMSNNRQGELKLTDAKAMFEDKYSRSGYEGDEASNPFFVKGLISFTNWCVKNEKSEMAKDWIALARKYMPEDKRIEEQYDMILN